MSTPSPRALSARSPSSLGRRALTALALVPALLSGRAAPAAAETPGFALNRFEPQGGGSDWFALESIDFRGSGRLSLFLLGDYAHKPLVIFDNATNEEVGALVERQIHAHVGGAVNIADRWRLALAMPIAVNQTGSTQAIGGASFTGPSGGSPGDVRVSADVRLFGEHRDPLRLALGAAVYLPTGKRDAFTGDGTVRVAPRLMAGGDLGLVVWAARFAFMTRGEIAKTDLTGVGMGHEVDGALALGVRPVDNVVIGPELFGSSVVTDGNAFAKRATPLEVLIGGRFTVADDWHLRVGASPGLTQGLGTPKFRVLAGLEYFPAVPPPDRDGDKVLDDDDACPDVPGRRTADPKTNGCPPPKDRDRDGVIDPEDACPDEPGVRTDDPRTNGCPPPKDRDKDGILDKDDACPDEPGVPNDDPKKHGCPPPPDRDKDGIIDAEDACVDVPGIKTGDPKTNGCADKDQDTIFDPEDACPDQPGPRDLDPKKNGCPVARVEKGQIRILEQVKFKTNSDVILPESDRILEAVAKILTENPEVKKIRVEGHTDNRGGRAFNKRLSDRRAASVVNWLVKRGGIDAGRMQSQGFGLERPIANNKTEEGRQENRRVEFHIVDPPAATP
jgi:outer membrane protein OmpA-like peptidoglycan-associated protein